MGIYAGKNLRDVAVFAVPIRAYSDGSGGLYSFFERALKIRKEMCPVAEE